MVEVIYQQLKIPRTFEELYQRICESGINWNRAQLKLFLLMDGNIKKLGDLYRIEGNQLNSVILDVIDRVMEGKPLVPIKKIMESMPDDIVVSAEEISSIAEQSGRYKIHPNRAVLMKK